MVTSFTVTSPEFPSVSLSTSVPLSSKVHIPEPASRLIAPAESTSTAPSTTTLRLAAAAALSTVVMLRTPLAAAAIVTVSLVVGVITIESSVMTNVPIVKSVVASIVVPVMPANSTASPVPTPIEVLSVAPLSATGSPLPSPTIIWPSVRTPIAVIAPVPEPRRTPPSVREEAPVPP